MKNRNLIAIIAMGTLFGMAAMAEDNPRFGKWKLKSDAPAPQSNVMTYEPHGDHGMKVTIDAVNKDGVKSHWSYVTNFDGKDEIVTGNPGQDATSVRVLSPKVNEIINKKGGKVTQVLTNVLGPDNQTIGVMYMRIDADGKVTNITNATYQKIQ
jgi:hypothetical protein